MLMPDNEKFIMLDNLRTFKDNLDTTYANTNNVYTKTEVDEAIANVGASAVTIAASQVISQSPLQVQLTDEQYTLMNEQSVIFNGTALGMTTVIADYIGSYDDEDDGIRYLKFAFVYSEDTNYLYFHTVIVNTSTKVAELRFDNIYPHQAYEADFAREAYEADSADSTNSINYSTTAPTSANTDGTLKVVVLSAEPATRYNGYLYIITGSN